MAKLGIWILRRERDRRASLCNPAWRCGSRDRCGHWIHLSFAKRELQASRIVAIEADPVLIPVIKHTHAVNGISAEVRNVVAAVTDGVVEFNRQPSFWASSIVDLPGSTKVRLPARSLQGLIEDVDPDVLVVDTEGAEGRLFEGLRLPRRLRHAVVEVHKQQIGLAAISACFDAMSKASLGYDPDGSSHTNVTFSRIDR